VTIWDDPTTDWTSGDGLRAVQLFGLAYADAGSARDVADAVGLSWQTAYEALPTAALWAELLGQAAETRRAYALAAELLHDPQRSQLAVPLRELLDERLPEANAALTDRHGLPSDPDARQALLENLDAVATSAALIEPVTTEGGALQAITDPRAGLVDQDLMIIRELDARRRMAIIRRAGAPLGTGFLVGPDLLLTAAHVLRNDGRPQPEDCVGLEAVFDYSRYGDPQRTPAESGQAVPVAALLRCSLPTDAEAHSQLQTWEAPADRLDYALLRLSSTVANENARDRQVRGHYRLDDRQLDLTRFASAHVYHHPLGEFLKQGTATGVLHSNQAGTRIRYGANTLAGSSGGLVLADDGHPIALHHYGLATTNQGIPIWLIARAVHDLLGQDTPSCPDGQGRDVEQFAVPVVRPHLALEVGGKPVVDREGFRDQLWKCMTTRDEPRQLLVVGPTDSGVSWSYRIINNVAGEAPMVPDFRAFPGGVCARKIDLRKHISLLPEERRGALIREVASAASATLEDTALAQAARHVSEFRDWCMRRFTGRDRQFWLFVDSIDDIAEIARHGVDEVLTALIDAADDEQTYLYLVLAGREANRLGHDSLVWIQPDTVSGLTRSAVRQWLEARVRENGGTVVPERVDAFLALWFTGDGPATEPERLSLALRQAAREVRA
jgi:V8-like Glu-specific endopeptidase